MCAFLCNALTVLAKNSGYVSNTSVINVSHNADLEIQDWISYSKASRFRFSQTFSSFKFSRQLMTFVRCFLN